ncbi:lipoprotein [Paraburkholderia sp. Ac-20336]|uniref:LPS translocon maturation chaperone LptM n=1 Tax=Burkholderiaceae TaxID=119060 RepID=UPI0014213104|nr:MULTISPECIES: lipoprotein [Burkholderiaceae]MBN3803002.1 lipoprotein [Paraburkholderia sp. Ac-20336]MBN3848430.1 lipoprotein [Paraburkholderia sp. Ac-20342]NIF54571.1 lipoprotein [Burkholderia sp. Ax-1724]NIF79970.1 lipoprotein [Paraburkholderia sp. Cy-641]
MRVVSRMRAAAPGRAIVAVLAIFAGCVLAGCGQRGSLYLPTVPPMPAPPAHRTQTPAPDQTQPASGSAADMGSIPDTSGTPLTLAPEDQLATPPASAASAPAVPLPASAAPSVQ